MSKYSTKIADAIQEFLHDDDWHYTFREEKGTFHFSLSTHSRLNTVDYFIAVREDHYRVLCVSPLPAAYGRGRGAAGRSGRYRRRIV